MSTEAAIHDPSADSALPDDVATLKALIRELLAVLEKTKQRNAQLEHRLDQLLRRVYGQKSEKLAPAQLLLFVEEESTPPSTENAPQTTVEPETETVTVTRTKGHGRRTLPANLPRVRKLYDLTEAEKLCPCCQTPRSKIGDDVSEQLEYVPASLFVIEHVTPKYVCPKCRDGIASAAKPASPIDKGLPGPGLLAQVAVSKYTDHLPLNRQEKIFRRHGVTLSRSTLCDWMMAVVRVCILDTGVDRGQPAAGRCDGAEAAEDRARGNRHSRRQSRSGAGDRSTESAGGVSRDPVHAAGGGTGSRVTL